MENKRVIFTNKAPLAIGPYSQAYVANGFLFTSGQLAIDPLTNNFINGTIEEQTEILVGNIKEILREANIDFNNIIKTTCFLANMNDFSAFNKVYEKYFLSKPARSCVAVKELPKNALVEIEVIAVL